MLVCGRRHGKDRPRAGAAAAGRLRLAQIDPDYHDTHQPEDPLDNTQVSGSGAKATIFTALSRPPARGGRLLLLLQAFKRSKTHPFSSDLQL